jgi:hypothetical protein
MGKWKLQKEKHQQTRKLNQIENKGDSLTVDDIIILEKKTISFGRRRKLYEMGQK